MIFVASSYNILLLSQEMWALFESYANEDNVNFDSDECFILVILSHGNRGVVFGVDSNPVPISDIVRKFCTVKSLMNKPKIFLLNCCQGSK